MTAPMRKKSAHADEADDLDRRIVLASQEGLALCPQPYHRIAEQIGAAPGDVMARMTAMLENGAIRRIAAVPNHYALGFTANGMSVWDVTEEDAASAGAAIGALPFVSHCYLRTRRFCHSITQIKTCVWWLVICYILPGDA